MPRRISDLWFRRYRVPSFLSIPEKTQLSVELLLPPPANVTQPVLSITYLSATSFPFATPSVVSTGFGWPSIGLGVEGVNSRVAHFLLVALRGDTMLRSWTLMDFYDKPVGSDIVSLLIECNFRGRPRDAHGAIVINPAGRPNRTFVSYPLSRPTVLILFVARDAITGPRLERFKSRGYSDRKYLICCGCIPLLRYRWLAILCRRLFIIA
jgi:hypothetical protein